MEEDTKIIPNLFLLGFQKCGSSALFDVLNSHPEIIGSAPKETFALVDDNYDHYVHKENVESKSFAWNAYYNEISDDVRYYLEGSVCNFYQKRAFEYISGIEGSKVIFLIRNPVKRFISCYNYSGKGGSNLPLGTSLEEFCDMVESHEIKNDLLRFALEHGRYGKYIDRWIDRLGPENVHVTSFENVRDNLQLEMEKIFSFLELRSVEVSPVLPKTNVTQVIKYEKLHYLLSSAFGGRGLLNRLRLKGLYDYLNRVRVPLNVGLTRDLEGRLKEYYKKEFERFKSLIG